MESPYSDRRHENAPTNLSQLQVRPGDSGLEIPLRKRKYIPPVCIVKRINHLDRANGGGVQPSVVKTLTLRGRSATLWANGRLGTLEGLGNLGGLGGKTGRSTDRYSLHGLTATVTSAMVKPAGQAADSCAAHLHHGQASPTPTPGRCGCIIFEPAAKDAG